MNQGTFLAQAWALSRDLPAGGHLINLCNDRYLFALAFAGALIRGAVSLFPPNRLAATCNELARGYPEVTCLTDTPLEGLRPPTCPISIPPIAGDAPPQMPLIPADRVAFIAFTSGTTGRPNPHPKYWGDLVGCAHAAKRRFGFGSGQSIVATVPPQHMYGLELSILVPWITGAAIAVARPFFPADIRAELIKVPARRVLITTPVHLRACAEADLDWPEVHLVISATAPLPIKLARRIETLMSTRVCEIYGSTESGSIASRETCRDPLWRWYDGVRAERDGETVSVDATFTHGQVPLADLLELAPNGRFRLIGRSTDMIKVAGKRASLADLNAKLNSIDGVQDGVFFAPEPDRGQVGRLAVIAVAPGLNRKAIIAGLAGRIDPVFYPRRVVLVDRLPRTEAGKLPRDALLRLLSDQSIGADDAH
jgi:acyl-coenzyme A synthetase/AMP-(fatty) acid ligase